MCFPYINKAETVPLCSTEWYCGRQTSPSEVGRGRAHEHREKLVGFLKNLGLAVIATEGEMDRRVYGVGWGLGVAADHEGGRWVMKDSW